MAKPKLALIPAAQGTKLYSVLPSDGSGDFTFTRGSVATRINAQGLIENVASGQSRLNYPMIDGVQKGCPHHILEPARTNVVQYSEDFLNGFVLSRTSAFGSGSEINNVISPEGSLNGSYIQQASGETSGGGVFNTVSYIDGTTYTISIFAKKKENRYIRLGAGIGVSGAAVFCGFDLQDGLVGSPDTGVTGKIENYGNGWYRCSITLVSQVTLSRNTFFYQSSNLNSFITTPLNGIYIWGASVEVGSYPTSYIPTSGTAVTRSAETATGAGNSTTFNDSEGVLMAEISALDNDGDFRVISVSDGTSDNRVVIYYSNDAKLKAFYKMGGNVFNGVFSIDNYDIEQNTKIIYKYKLNDFQLWVNGFKLASSNSGSVLSGNTFNTLNFNAGSSTEFFYGKAKQIQYFDSILADTQLEQLTSWQSFRDMAEGQLYTIE